MMSVSDLRSEQPAPDLHNLMYHLLICVILWLDVQVTMCVAVHSLPEVLHRDTKPSCCLNTSDLTRMGVPTCPFHGGHSKDQVSFCPLLLVSARLQIQLKVSQELSQTTGQLHLWDNHSNNY